MDKPAGLNAESAEEAGGWLCRVQVEGGEATENEVKELMGAGEYEAFKAGEEEH